ncbi:MAG TPA: SDR family oxidoreductase [Patescibacteria group bacterium]|nr:SDR family oxidoreductase [Patescibacteria group bacterium]
MTKDKRKTVCVLGHEGFIGSALTRELLKTGEVTHFPSEKCRVIYDFASPTHEGFDANVDYNFNTIIPRMAYLMRYCADHNIKYVYPSSALVYELDRPFKAFKEITEKMQDIFPADSLALRIFPVYGVGEKRTVIYQWCMDILAGRQPTVFGDGTQIRDFIYIDDVISNILKLSKTKTGFVDIGPGKPHTFNKIIALINKEAKTNIKPKYVKEPNVYSKGIFCKNPVPCIVSLREGIRKVLASQGYQL